MWTIRSINFLQSFLNLYGYKKVSKKHKNRLKEISYWLKIELANLNIEGTFLFESFLYSVNYDDADRMIKTKDSNYQNIKQTAISLKRLSDKLPSGVG
jgi:hypothetical protein